MSVTLYGQGQYLPSGRVLESQLGTALFEFQSRFNPNVIYAPGHFRRDNDDALEGLFEFEDREPAWMNWWQTSTLPPQPPVIPPPPPVIPPPPVNPPPGTPEVRLPDPPPGGGDDVATPEPSTFVLVIAALILVMLFRRFRSVTA